ncbi:MAG: cytochrome P450 [Chloroflexi bacterium]|nr:cytochrome P450 [Chloroflexota bacterium]
MTERVRALSDGVWDPRSDAFRSDPWTAYDELRERCPVAFSDALQWSLFRHEDVMRVLHDPLTFSNQVSSHRAVPNGMDPPEHTEYRRLIEPFFAPERVAAFEPVCRAIAARLWRAAALPEMDFAVAFARPFAALCQCAFLGWEEETADRLLQWVDRQHEAIFRQDRRALSDLAQELHETIQQILRRRREMGDSAPDDATTRLLQARVGGRAVSDEELVSILRNWTAGEVGTLSAAVSILANFLAVHPEVQRRLREDPSTIEAASDEILRIHGPLLANRRITRRAVDIGGTHIPAGQIVTLIWVAANRDPRAFEQPLEFRLDRDPAQNLVYGAGIHACPGAPLARLELRVALEEVLGGSAWIEPVPDRPAVFASFPSTGFSSLPLRIQPERAAAGRGGRV